MDLFLVDYIAGVCSGIAVVLVGHPFDTTKTRMQTSPVGIYSNTADCIRKTYAEEGMRGFYAGIGSPLVGQMIFRASIFSAYYLSQRAMKHDLAAFPTVVQNSHYLQAFLCGASTGLLVSAIGNVIVILLA